VGGVRFAARLAFVKNCYVYILASASGVLYTGVTNDIQARILQHRQKAVEGFSSRYNVTRLVYFEIFGDVRLAIAREKQIKSWRREKRVALINSQNSRWADLSADWFPPHIF
jgi:putative endonuclease